MDFVEADGSQQRAKFLGGIRSVETRDELPPLNEIEDSDIFYIINEHTLVSKNDTGNAYISAIQGVINILQQKIDDLESATEQKLEDLESTVTDLGTSSESSYVKKAGDTMTGNLTMQNGYIAFVKKSGNSTVNSGGITINNSGDLNITGLATPTANKDAANKAYVDSSSVSSFKGRKGVVSPASGDYTAAMVGAVPTTRTVNSKALSSNITLSASDVGALATTGGSLTGAVTTSSTLTIGSMKISYNATTKALEFQHL